MPPPFNLGGNLKIPTGVTFGPNGNLFVSYLNSEPVTEFDSGTGFPIGAFTSLAGGQFELKFGPNSGPCGLLDDDGD